MAPGENELDTPDLVSFSLEGTSAGRLLHSPSQKLKATICINVSLCRLSLSAQRADNWSSTLQSLAEQPLERGDRACLRTPRGASAELCGSPGAAGWQRLPASLNALRGWFILESFAAWVLTTSVNHSCLRQAYSSQ